MGEPEGYPSEDVEAAIEYYDRLTAERKVIRGTLVINDLDNGVYGITPNGLDIRLFTLEELVLDINREVETDPSYQEVFGFELVYGMVRYPVREISAMEIENRLMVTFHYASGKSRMHTMPTDTPKYERMVKILGRLWGKPEEKIPKRKWELHRMTF